MVLKIGLTGGIGSGKSTVCSIFSKIGTPSIDADIIAKRLVQPGMPALRTIINFFGETITQKDGSLDRKKLRKKIFSSKADRKKLESIMHPIIYDSMLEEIKTITAEYCILSIPLLLETDFCKMTDRILVVDLPKSLQLIRVSKRDDIKENEVNRIIGSQISRKKRCAAANDILNNSKDVEYLRQQIFDLHALYSTL